MSLKKVKWIFFDNDGILVDTEALYFQANREVLASIGIDLTRERFMRISMQEGHSTFVLAEELGFDPKTIKELHDIRNRRYAELLADGVRIMDGVSETLRELAGKVSMGVVTSCRKVHFELIHKHTGLLDFFNFIITTEDVRRTKPDPEPYLKALELSGCRTSECLVVEDSERGLTAARAAGIGCMVVPNHLSAHGDFSCACRVLDNIQAIVDYVTTSSGSF